jgi:hypothetical protein
LIQLLQHPVSASPAACWAAADLRQQGSLPLLLLLLVLLLQTALPLHLQCLAAQTHYASQQHHLAVAAAAHPCRCDLAH